MLFSDVVEVIKGLSADEKQEIYLLLKQDLRAEEIYQNYQAALTTQAKGELNFSSDINELMRILEN